MALDMTYCLVPPTASLLYAVELPTAVVIPTLQVSRRVRCNAWRTRRVLRAVEICTTRAIPPGDLRTGFEEIDDRPPFQVLLTRRFKNTLKRDATCCTWDAAIMLM